MYNAWSDFRETARRNQAIVRNLQKYVFKSILNIFNEWKLEKNVVYVKQYELLLLTVRTRCVFWNLVSDWLERSSTKLMMVGIQKNTAFCICIIPSFYYHVMKLKVNSSMHRKTQHAQIIATICLAGKHLICRSVEPVLVQAFLYNTCDTLTIKKQSLAELGASRPRITCTMAECFLTSNF